MGRAREREAPPPHVPFAARPYVWRDPHLIPPREWVYGRHLIRQFVSATVAPGGLGKSSLAIVDCLAMATGRDLIGDRPVKRLRVWYWNLEDPQEEIDRRIAAACLHYGIKKADLDGYLFVNSGRDTPLVIATRTADGLTIARPVLRNLEAEISARQIDVLVLDPFIATHRVPENDNGDIAQVVQEWSALADTTDCAIEHVHHVRKGQSGQGEYTVNDGRGAGAFLAGVRSARVLNGMSKEEAERYDIESRRAFFRVDNGKANLAPPPDEAAWRHIVSIDLGNARMGLASDHVGVVTAWSPPGALDGLDVHDLRAAQKAVAEGGPWRAHPQATAWVGKPIATALGLNVERKADRKKVERALAIWKTTGMFEEVDGLDEQRNKRKFVEVGEWATD